MISTYGMLHSDICISRMGQSPFTTPGSVDPLIP